MGGRPDGERLTTWAEIGGYIGRDARTAKRYEQERGLPVRRLPGGGKSTVYAFRAEIDQWLRRDEDPALEPPPPQRLVAAPAPASAPQQAPEPTRSHIRRLATAVATGALALIATVVGFSVLAPVRPAGASPAARNLYEEGAYAWSLRTPQGLARAIDAFTQAVVADPGYAQAYVGLANSYNLGPEFAKMRPADAYLRAQAAAERAIALAPNSPDAHRALAFALFWWAQETPAAMREFRTALALDDRSPEGHLWYANALAALGDPRALSEMDRAVQLQPSTTVMTDRGWAYLMLEHDAQAEATLRDVLRLAPDYAPAHAYLAQVARRRGDDAAMLGELTRAAELKGDAEELRVAQAGRAGLASGGHDRMKRAMFACRQALFAQNHSHAFELAAEAAQSDQHALALDLLARAKAEHDPRIMSLAHNDDFRSLRGDVAFRRLLPPAA